MDYFAPAYASAPGGIEEENEMTLIRMNGHTFYRAHYTIINFTLYKQAKAR